MVFTNTAKEYTQNANNQVCSSGLKSDKMIAFAHLADAPLPDT